MLFLLYDDVINTSERDVVFLSWPETKSVGVKLPLGIIAIFSPSFIDPSAAKFAVLAEK